MRCSHFISGNEKTFKEMKLFKASYRDYLFESSPFTNPICNAIALAEGTKKPASSPVFHELD